MGLEMFRIYSCDYIQLDTGPFKVKRELQMWSTFELINQKNKV